MDILNKVNVSFFPLYKFSNANRWKYTARSDKKKVSWNYMCVPHTPSRPLHEDNYVYRAMLSRYTIVLFIRIISCNIPLLCFPYCVVLYIYHHQCIILIKKNNNNWNKIIYIEYDRDNNDKNMIPLALTLTGTKYSSYYL